MNIDNQNFSQQELSGSKKAQNKKALMLDDLKVILETRGIPEEEKKAFINSFRSKIKKETDEDLLEAALANVSLAVVKRSAEIKKNANLPDGAAPLMPEQKLEELKPENNAGEDELKSRAEGLINRIDNLVDGIYYEPTIAAAKILKRKIPGLSVSYKNLPAKLEKNGYSEKTVKSLQAFLDHLIAASQGEPAASIEGKAGKELIKQTEEKIDQLAELNKKLGEKAEVALKNKVITSSQDQAILELINGSEPLFLACDNGKYTPELLAQIQEHYQKIQQMADDIFPEAPPNLGASENNHPAELIFEGSKAENKIITKLEELYKEYIARTKNKDFKSIEGLVAKIDKKEKELWHLMRSKNASLIKKDFNIIFKAATDKIRTRIAEELDAQTEAGKENLPAADEGPESAAIKKRNHELNEGREILKGGAQKFYEMFITAVREDGEWQKANLVRQAEYFKEKLENFIERFVSAKKISVRNTDKNYLIDSTHNNFYYWQMSQTAK